MNENEKAMWENIISMVDSMVGDDPEYSERQRAEPAAAGTALEMPVSSLWDPG